MASIFKQTGRTTWNAKIRTWDAASGTWKWRKISTHVTGQQEALGIAVTLEKASKEAGSGQMTKARAEELVSSILQLAGVPWSVKSVTLADFGKRYVTAAVARARQGAKAKAPAHWARFVRWAGAKIDQPMENCDVRLFAAYYVDLLTEYSERTCNDHMATLRQMFGRAEKEGLLRGNPVALVDQQVNQSVEKRVFTRLEISAMLRIMRAAARKDWALLLSLGWATGGRVQDLLSLTRDNIEVVKNVGYVVSFKPAKKAHLKNAREVVLPVPSFVAKGLVRMIDLRSIHNADNRNGKVSEAFILWMVETGIDPLRVARGKRSVPRKSFHSLRHSLVSRMTSAGISGELTQLAVDHDDAKMRQRYSHAEVKSLAEALSKARRQ